MSLGAVVGFATGVLRKSEISYAVVGGLAVSARGQPRLTRDIDVIISIQPKQVPALLDAIEAAGLKISRRRSIEDKLKKGRPAKISRQSDALDWERIKNLAEDLAAETGMEKILSNLSAVRVEAGR